MAEIEGAATELVVQFRSQISPRSVAVNRSNSRFLATNKRDLTVRDKGTAHDATKLTGQVV